MSDVNDSVPVLRTKIFSEHWPFDEAIRGTASTLPSRSFLADPSGQYPYCLPDSVCKGALRKTLRLSV